MYFVNEVNLKYFIFKDVKIVYAGFYSYLIHQSLKRYSDVLHRLNKLIMLRFDVDCGLFALLLGRLHKLPGLALHVGHIIVFFFKTDHNSKPVTWSGLYREPD